MKEVNGPEKDLREYSYTDAEFDQAVSDGEARQANTESNGPVEDTGLTDEQAREITAITLMRIYDMLGAILTHLDETSASAVLDTHANGKLVGPVPYLDM